ncbi:hypothetical protein L1987_00591 [Smallanthus sonchifolius]|uniref:Uncharacterized protein n=1 Tax=Smallanthus sonchifolius TaxID=185202 RepID=A0ACB9K2P0_9ASTR|nr:hypothetical protein L1987_00591 [Smallanthus sonchifolius]
MPNTNTLKRTDPTNIKVHQLLFSPVPLLFSSVPEGPSAFLNFRKAFTVCEGSFFPLANSPEDESHGLASGVAVTNGFRVEHEPRSS